MANTHKRSFVATPNYIAPFDGWIVVCNDEVHPEYIKKFVGLRAQLDAQTLAFLLNAEGETK